MSASRATGVVDALNGRKLKLVACSPPITATATARPGQTKMPARGVKIIAGRLALGFGHSG